MARSDGVKLAGSVHGRCFRRYMDLAELSKALLLARRSLHWKINFGFWTAISLVGYYVLRPATPGSLPARVGPILVILAAVVCCLHHLLITASDSKDMDAINHFRAEALYRANPKDRFTREQRDTCRLRYQDANLQPYAYIRKRLSDVWHRFVPEVLTTVLLAVGVCLMGGSESVMPVGAHQGATTAGPTGSTEFVTMLLSVLLGGAITLGVSWLYYRKSSEDLRWEARAGHIPQDTLDLLVAYHDWGQDLKPGYAISLCGISGYGYKQVLEMLQKAGLATCGGRSYVTPEGNAHAGGMESDRTPHEGYQTLYLTTDACGLVKYLKRRSRCQERVIELRKIPDDGRGLGEVVWSADADTAPGTK
jgi:hypothetical protein